MAVYTEKLGDIITDLTPEVTEKYFPTDELIKKGRERIFGPYPIFDESYRPILESNILRFFWNYEIGSETRALFKFQLNEYMIRNMPYFNLMYESSIKKFNWQDYMIDTNLKDSVNENRHINQSSKSVGNQNIIGSENSSSHQQEINKLMDRITENSLRNKSGNNTNGTITTGTSNNTTTGIKNLMQNTINSESSLSSKKNIDKENNIKSTRNNEETFTTNSSIEKTTDNEYVSNFNSGNTSHLQSNVNNSIEKTNENNSDKKSSQNNEISDKTGASTESDKITATTNNISNSINLSNVNTDHTLNETTHTTQNIKDVMSDKKHRNLDETTNRTTDSTTKTVTDMTDQIIQHNVTVKVQTGQDKQDLTTDYQNIIDHAQNGTVSDTANDTMPFTKVIQSQSYASGTSYNRTTQDNSNTKNGKMNVAGTKSDINMNWNTTEDKKSDETKHEETNKTFHEVQVTTHNLTQDDTEDQTKNEDLTKDVERNLTENTNTDKKENNSDNKSELKNQLSGKQINESSSLNHVQSENVIGNQSKILSDIKTESGNINEATSDTKNGTTSTIKATTDSNTSSQDVTEKSLNDQKTVNLKNGLLSQSDNSNSNNSVTESNKNNELVKNLSKQQVQAIAGINESEKEITSHNQNKTSDTSNNGSKNSNSRQTGKSSNIGNTNTDNIRTFIQTKIGKKNATDYPDLLLKWRKTFINIDNQIISGIFDEGIFMQLW